MQDPKIKWEINKISQNLKFNKLSKVQTKII